MAKIYVCDTCGGRLGASALGSTKGGQYCSVKCKERKSKTHVIDGVTYVEVDRKAKVGDKVIIIKYPDDEAFIGSIYRTIDVTDIGIIAAEGVLSVSSRGVFYSDEYYVLAEVAEEEPTVDTTQASEQVIEMFAALSRKIVSLEHQLVDTQRNVERQAEEIANLQWKTESNTQDIAMLDARTQSKVAEEEGIVTLPKWWVEILAKHAGGDFR